MTINQTLHSQADVDRLYFNENIEGTGRVSIEECVRIKGCSLSDYTKRIKQMHNSVTNKANA